MRITLRRLGVGFALVTVALVASGLPAAAHVTVNPRVAAQGGYAKLAFRVPNERDVATTKLEVALPESQPLASVSTRPMQGWKVEVVKAKLAKPIVREGDDNVTEAVSRIVWTAESPADAIGAGQFTEFEISVGPLPKDAKTMVFKALQTYADGEVVRWIDEASGSEEPEHPAPVLTLTEAAGDDHHDEQVTASAAHEEGHDDDSANWPAWVGLVAGLAGLVLGAVALVRTRRPAA